MRVAVLAEFYPRAVDPVLGVWAHRQAQSARLAGAEIEVFVLHRVVPPASSFTTSELRRLLSQPHRVRLDGLPVTYVRYVSPSRARSYARWGAWAAPALRLAVRRAEDRSGRFDLVHAHNAVPAGDAGLRAHLGRPLIVSVHGGDVLWTVDRVPGGAPAVERTLDQAALVLGNSSGIVELARRRGATRTEVVHLGTDVPEAPAPSTPYPLLVTVAHLVARKRHADVLHALARLPADVCYRIIGDGPERPGLERLAQRLGLADRVEFAGQLPPDETLRRAREGWLFVMPSTEEAFGVAYVEAMAAGIPAIGALGEPGPAEIAAAGSGIELVAPRDPVALATLIADLLARPERRAELGAAARETAAVHFSWRHCGLQTVAAYRTVIARGSDSGGDP